MHRSRSIWINRRVLFYTLCAFLVLRTPLLLQGQSSSPAEEIAQLRALVLDQKKAIEELKVRLDKYESVVAAIQKRDETGRPPAAVTQVAAAATPAPAGSAVTVQQAQPVTAAMKPKAPAPSATAAQPSGQLSLGGFKFSGDFRLRFDMVERSANQFAGAIHNVRGRYRFRWNTDKDINSQLRLRLQLASGPPNNGVSAEQDFTSIILRHPFMIHEVHVDYHPQKNLSFQVGRVEEVFADNTRFQFDDRARFNGLNEKWKLDLGSGGFRALELRAAQYVFTNPNTPIVKEGTPLALAGAAIGSQGRAAQLFHQGAILTTGLGKQLTQNTRFDVQIYRNPNQIALGSTATGVALASSGLGITLSGPIPGTGNATTTPGGAIYNAKNFHILTFSHDILQPGFVWRNRKMPIIWNFQASRNVGAAWLRDAVMGSVNIGKVQNLGDVRWMYGYFIKDANSMIGQFTDQDLGTDSAVNVASHYLRFDYGLGKGIVLQHCLFLQNQRRESNPAANFYVPTPRGASQLFRYYTRVEFTF